MDRDVPYIVYESEAARHERTVARLVKIIVLTLLLLVASNMAWLYVWNQYDFSSTTTEIVTDEGNTNMLEAGMNGEINNVNKDKAEEQDSNKAE